MPNTLEKLTVLSRLCSWVLSDGKKTGSGTERKEEYSGLGKGKRGSDGVISSFQYYPNEPLTAAVTNSAI